MIAVTLTAIGFAYDAGTGNKELSTVFASSYVLGCIFAVLAVRQSGIFTAVIQPPLILFGAVPTAYFLFHGGQLGGVKDPVAGRSAPVAALVGADREGDALRGAGRDVHDAERTQLTKGT